MSSQDVSTGLQGGHQDSSTLTRRPSARNVASSWSKKGFGFRVLGFRVRGFKVRGLGLGLGMDVFRDCARIPESFVM